MKGHLGAVLTSGIAAMAVVLVVLLALVVANPVGRERTASESSAGRSIPWTPAATPRDEPARERDVKPREHHRPPPRNRGGFLPDQGPRPPRRASA